MSELTLTGLATCDTCRKARRWLDENQKSYGYRDVRRDGLDVTVLTRWADSVGWETLVNRKSRTWRELPPAERVGLDQHSALALLLAHPTLLKRPVLEGPDGTVIVGFDPVAYAEL